MAETTHPTSAEQIESERAARIANLQPALSHAALTGIGIATQHFYGADEHFIGRTPSNEHRLVINTPDQQGQSSTETVGAGDDPTAALQDSLKQMRSKESIHTRSLAHLEMTPDTFVSFTPLEAYKPRVAPGSEAYPIPDHLESLVTNNIQGDDTYKNTVEQPGWQTGVRSVLEDYVANDIIGQQLVTQLKIKSLNHLTPEQAIKLSSAFVQNVSKYSYADIVARSQTRADKSTAPALLREGMAQKNNPNWQGNGVCRNIASNVKAVFESLKQTQGELSMLNNTYAVFGGGWNGAGYQDKREDNFSYKTETSGHAWNTFVTVDAKGSAVATIIDATWALGANAENSAQDLDRTLIRAALPIKKLFERSTEMSKAFLGLSNYTERLIQKVATDHKLSATSKANIREHAVTNYLQAASQLSEIPEDYILSGTIISAAFRMSGKLERMEITTLFKLDQASGLLEIDRLKAIITKYDKQREIPLPRGITAKNVVFSDDTLQAIAYEAIGGERIFEHAENSGSFRARLRDLRPDMLPAFDPYTRPADARELRDLASASNLPVQVSDPKGIIRTAHRTLERIIHDPVLYEAVIAGRSDYDLVRNFGAIRNALSKR